VPGAEAVHPIKAVATGAEPAFAKGLGLQNSGATLASGAAGAAMRGVPVHPLPDGYLAILALVRGGGVRWLGTRFGWGGAS